MTWVKWAWLRGWVYSWQKNFDYFFCLEHQYGRSVYCRLCLLGLWENQEYKTLLLQQAIKLWRHLFDVKCLLVNRQTCSAVRMTVDASWKNPARINTLANPTRATSCWSTHAFKGALNPKIDFSSFEHLGLVEQLYEVFLNCLPRSPKKYRLVMHGLNHTVLKKKTQAFIHKGLLPSFWEVRSTTPDVNILQPWSAGPVPSSTTRRGYTVPTRWNSEEQVIS